MGYLASVDDISEGSIRKAMMSGTVVASFNIEDFSINRQKFVQFNELKHDTKNFKMLCDFR